MQFTCKCTYYLSENISAIKTWFVLSLFQSYWSSLQVICLSILPLKAAPVLSLIFPQIHALAFWARVHNLFCHLQFPRWLIALLQWCTVASSVGFGCWLDRSSLEQCFWIWWWSQPIPKPSHQYLIFWSTSNYAEVIMVECFIRLGASVLITDPSCTLSWSIQVWNLSKNFGLAWIQLFWIGLNWIFL